MEILGPLTAAQITVSSKKYTGVLNALKVVS